MIGQDILHAQALLQAGNVVAIPTETVYGLAAIATNIDAVARIFEIKQRPNFDPLIVHIHKTEQLSDIAHINNEVIFDLAAAFWPGALTIVLPKKSNIPDLVSAGLPTVAVRIPNHPLTLKLLKSIKLPLAAPSANPFGFVSPTTAQHVEDQLGNKIPYILDGGSAAIGLESTIIDFTTKTPKILRLGGVEIEALSDFLKIKLPVQNSSSNPQAPGMLLKHYSPGKKIMIGEIEDLCKSGNTNNFGILSFSTDYRHLNPKEQIILSKSADLSAAANFLFQALRNIALWKTDVVYAEMAPNYGIGRAINDRLMRASA